MSLLVKWLESLNVDVTITDKCSRKRNLHSTCRICLDVCKYEALSINEQSIEINPECCTSCGDCMISCPLSVIEGIPASREFDKGSLIYHDGYTPLVKELLIYKKRGLSSIKVNGNPINQKWETVIIEANTKLKFLGQGPIEMILKGEEETLSRREFFSSFRKEGKQLAKSMAPSKWKLEADEWNVNNYYLDYQFYTVMIDENKCTLCRACSSFCSQKVFSLTDSFLQIENEKCVNCTDCTDICPEHAIQIKSDFKKKGNIHAAFYIKECGACGQSFRTFQPKMEKCHICKDRNHDWLSPYQ